MFSKKTSPLILNGGKPALVVEDVAVVNEDAQACIPVQLGRRQSVTVASERLSNWHGEIAWRLCPFCIKRENVNPARTKTRLDALNEDGLPGTTRTDEDDELMLSQRIEDLFRLVVGHHAMAPL